MSTGAARALEERLTERIAAIEGVRAVFPEHAATLVLDRVLRHGSAPVGRVRVDDGGPALRVSARLATLRTVPAQVIVAAAVQAVAGEVGDRPYSLDLEFSTID